MSERVPYSRLYWSVIDDGKFTAVYDDDAAWALYTRLLMIADQAWPASAHVPVLGTTATREARAVLKARQAALALLATERIVDLVPGNRYRIHGLDAERERRADAARRRPHRDPIGTQSGPNRDPTATGPEALDETRRDEQRRDETSTPVLEEDEPYVVAYFNATHRAPTPLQRARLYELHDRHSLEWLVENLTGDDPLGHCFEVDTAWQRERRKAADAEERAWKRQKRAEAQQARREVARAFAATGGDA